MGFILFGVMILVHKEVLNIPLNTFTVLLSYGLGGGLLLGGLVSGIILYVSFSRLHLRLPVILEYYRFCHMEYTISLL